MRHFNRNFPGFPVLTLLLGLVLGLAACNSDDPNTPPVASNVAVSTNQGQPVSGTLTASDSDGDALTYSIDQSNPNLSKGDITLDNASTGAFTYTPLPQETGTNSFIFSVSDGTDNSNEATLTINVIPSAAGIWTGESVAQGSGDSSAVIAIIATDGQAALLLDESTLLFGELASTGTAATGTLGAYAAAGSTFPDGSSTGLVALDGLVATGSQFSGTLSGVGETSDFRLDYDSETFETSPALANLNGSFTAELAGGESLNVSFDSVGNLTGSDSGGCQYAGTAMLISPVTNVYALQANVNACSERSGSYIGLASLVKSDTNPAIRCLACENMILFGIEGETNALVGRLED